MNLISISPQYLETPTRTVMRQPSLFESERMSMLDAILLSIESLRHYGELYDEWCIAYSGGKDSSATVAFIMWAIKNKLVPAPKTLYVLYADTGMELTPLWTIASRFLEELRTQGVDARRVLPSMDDRFYVYMLGRGVKPPSNRFRWCTERIKVKPMEAELEHVAGVTGKKFLQITGVRQGESAARDARITVSCSTDDGECGQGWFQAKPSAHVADTLAPLVHWRQCYVWDWLYEAWSDIYVQRVLGFEGAKGHGYEYLGDIAVAYGADAGRTGCIGCNLASHDKALDTIIQNPQWAHLTPLTGIKPLYEEITKAKWRLRKAAPVLLKDGSLPKNGQRLGPLTMDARAYALDRILDIQRRAGVTLIDAEMEARIRELWTLDTWPQGWEGGLGDPNNVIGDAPLDRITVASKQAITQPRLEGI
jgi:DNA sulfur modification protein DndC